MHILDNPLPPHQYTGVSVSPTSRYDATRERWWETTGHNQEREMRLLGKVSAINDDDLATHPGLARSTIKKSSSITHNGGCSDAEKAQLYPCHSLPASPLIVRRGSAERGHVQRAISWRHIIRISRSQTRISRSSGRASSAQIEGDVCLDVQRWAHNIGKDGGVS